MGRKRTGSLARSTDALAIKASAQVGNGEFPKARCVAAHVFERRLATKVALRLVHPAVNDLSILRINDPQALVDTSGSRPKLFSKIAK